MSELTWALLAIAAALLAGLFLWGKWQERRTLQRLDRSLRSGVGDPLMGTKPTARTTAGRHPPQRIEPRMASDADLHAVSDDLSPPGGELSGPQPSNAMPAAIGSDRPVRASAASRTSPAKTAAELGWVEDPMLDFVVELHCHHAFDGVAALDARAQIERLALPLPTHLAVWDAKQQQWAPPDRFGFYSEMLIAVQKCARGVTLGEIEASRFLSAVEQVAVALDADFDVPDMQALIAQVTELDAMAAEFDVQITLTLAGSENWSRDQVARAAHDAGFAEIGAQKWAQRGTDGQPLITLQAPAMPASTVTLALDVPRVPVAEAPLPRLFGAARELAASLSAKVVDDNGRPVLPTAEAAIEAELVPLHAQMRAAGIEPGGERARRLYTA